MQKEDARKQSREVLHERRKQVVRMHRKGVGVMQIVEQTGLSRTAVNTALRLHSEGSGAMLKPAVRGKKADSGRSLSPPQEAAINAALKHAITSKVPVRTKAKLRQAATDHMTMREQTPQRVKKYFGDPKVACAAS